MNQATLSAEAPGQWLLSGALDFASVPVIWSGLAEVIAANPHVSLSLRAVDRANSAGLVLLVEARDLARRSGCRLDLSEVPQELVDLASMSQVAALIAGPST